MVRSENAHFTLLWDGASRTQRLQVLQALSRSSQGADIYGGDLPRAAQIFIRRVVRCSGRSANQLLAEELVERNAEPATRSRSRFLREWVIGLRVVKRYSALERAQRVDVALGRMAVDLGELVVGELEVRESAERVLELRDA